MVNFNQVHGRLALNMLPQQQQMTQEKPTNCGIKAGGAFDELTDSEILRESMAYLKAFVNSAHHVENIWLMSVLRRCSTTRPSALRVVQSRSQDNKS